MSHYLADIVERERKARTRDWLFAAFAISIALASLASLVQLVR